MPTKRNIESRIESIEDASNETDAEQQGLLVACHDEESDTYYDHEGNVVDCSRADMVIAVPTDEEIERQIEDREGG